MQYWDHIDRVMRAASLEEAKAATHAFTQAMGFEHHGYAVKLQEPGESLDAGYLYFEDFASDWSKTYIALPTPQVASNDPRVLIARAGLPAVAWNSRGDTSYAPPDPHIRKRTRTTLQRASEFGLHGGITVPSASPGVDWGFMTFTHSAATDPRELIPTIGSSVYFVNCLQAALDRLTRRPRRMVPLSPRECEVLRWSAIGKTSWEISEILRISERTVNFHLQQVSRKLGVKGRRASCARAVGMGLISL